jgi:uncharacterized protein (DUF58 family)
METAELLKKIRRIEIATSRMVTEVFAGQYHSVFKGRGIEFEEVREYLPGDEVRSIDWNVTARTGRPHVKKFVEERELTVLIAVDISTSSVFGTARELKSRLMAELASVFAFSAIRNNDKVGFLAFSDKIESHLPPRKGSKYVLRIVREALGLSEGIGSLCRMTDLGAALEHINRTQKRRAVVFLISDFYAFNPASPSEMHFTEDLKKKLAVTHKRHDLIAVTLTDPRETELPHIGILKLNDAESNKSVFVDSSSPEARRRFRDKMEKFVKMRHNLFVTTGIDHIDIRTDVPYIPALVRFFRERERRLYR